MVNNDFGQTVYVIKYTHGQAASFRCIYIKIYSGFMTSNF